MTHPAGARAPELSVILVTDVAATLRPVISCLRRQGDPARLELVLVAQTGGWADVVPADLAPFGAVQLLEVESVVDMAAARALAVQRATTPLVFIGETHSFPRPGWAEGLIAAHAGPWESVVPSLGNADRRGVVNRAGYVLDYARWAPWRKAGEMPDPLLYNASYKRSVLLALGQRLPVLLNPYREALWQELRARGARAWFAPEAKLDHLSVGRAGFNVWERFLQGLMTAGERRARWPWYRCLLYCLGSPLVPFVLIAREWPAIRGAPASERLGISLLPFMLLTSSGKALGEMIAYAVGTPHWVEPWITRIEIQRLRFCRPFTP